MHILKKNDFISNLYVKLSLKFVLVLQVLWPDIIFLCYFKSLTAVGHYSQAMELGVSGDDEGFAEGDGQVDVQMECSPVVDLEGEACLHFFHLLYLLISCLSKLVTF